MLGALAISIYGKVLSPQKEELKLLLENETTKSKWALSQAIVFVHTPVHLEIKRRRKGYSHQLLQLNWYTMSRRIWEDRAKNDCSLFSKQAEEIEKGSDCKHHYLGTLCYLFQLSQRISTIHSGLFWSPQLGAYSYPAIWVISQII